jgi:hypothetical protein
MDMTIATTNQSNNCSALELNLFNKLTLMKKKSSKLECLVVNVSPHKKQHSEHKQCCCQTANSGNMDDLAGGKLREIGSLAILSLNK